MEHKDYVAFYFKEKAWDKTEPMPEIVVETYNPLAWRLAKFTGYLYRKTALYSKHSKQAKRNRRKYDYEAIYVNSDNGIVRYPTLIVSHGNLKFVDRLEDLPNFDFNAL